MKILAIVFAFTSFCCCSCGEPQSPPPITVQQVLDRFILASGGRQRIDRITSSRFVLIGKVNEDSVRVKMIRKKPRQLATMTETRGQTYITRYSNGKGTETTDGQTQDINDSTYLELLSLQSHILPEMHLDPKQQRIHLSVDTIDGIAYYKLSLYTKYDQLLYANYYHPQTGLLDIQKDRFGSMTYYLDYRFYKGFNVPHSAKAVNKDSRAEMILTDIALDEEIEAAIFQ